MLIGATQRAATTIVDVFYGVSGRLGVARSFGRFAFMAVVLTGLILLPWRPSPQTAEWVSIVLIAAGVAIGVGALTLLRRLLAQLIAVDGDTVSLFGGRVAVAIPLVKENMRALEGPLRLVRRAGLALPALIFFVFWALIYMLLWSLDPAACATDPPLGCSGAFWGLGSDPSFGDFVYMSVNMAFANPVPDMIATSQVARAAVTLEVLTGIGLATLYASSFFGLRGESRPEELGGSSAPLGS